MTDTCFTCIGKSHGAPAIPATREAWEKLRSEKWLAHMCRRIVAGEEKLKGKLPIWTPSCAAFKGNHRAVKDVLTPLPRLMLDFDQKGHSQEILERSLQLQEQGKWEILLVEESVRKGTHVLITLPEGMSPQEAQNRFSHDVGFHADPALKDVARCIYMVPAENTLFVNERIFSPQSVIQSEAKNLGNTKADTHVDASEILRRSAPLDDKKGENAPLDNKEKNTPLLGGAGGGLFPTTHEGIPYTHIIEVLEEQMGGRPDIGSRNNFIFSMACHLRYICNDDPS